MPRVVTNRVAGDEVVPPAIIGLDLDPNAIVTIPGGEVILDDVRQALDEDSRRTISKVYPPSADYLAVDVRTNEIVADTVRVSRDVVIVPDDRNSRTAESVDNQSSDGVIVTVDLNSIDRHA